MRQILFACLSICLCLGCQTLKKTGVANKTDISKIQQLYKSGRYCELVPILEAYLPTLSPETTTWQEATIITTKTYLELEQWVQAEKVLHQLANSDIIPNTNTSYQVLLLKARLLEKREHIAEAESLYEDLLRRLQNKAEQKSLFLETVLYYSSLQALIGNYDQAEQQLLQISPTVNPALAAKAYNVLAFLYLGQTKFTQARQYFLATKNILDINQLGQHPYYALFLNDYAVFNFSEGNLEVADSLLSQSERINQACSIPSITGFNYSTKANIHYLLGDLDKAKLYFDKAQKTFLSIEQHQEASLSAFKLGEVYAAMEDVAAANNNFEAALKYHKRFIGEREHLHKGQILGGMAGLAVYDWNYELADSLYEENKRIIEITLGKRNFEYGTVLNNLASSKEAQGDYTTAQSFYQQTAELDTLLSGKYHTNYKTTLFNLARCYSKMDSSRQTAAYYEQAIDLQLQLLEDYFGDFSETTRLSYRLDAMQHFDAFSTYACSKNDPILNTILQNINLATKNRVLDFSIQTQAIDLAEQDTNLQKIYQQWVQQKELLTKLYLQSEPERATLGISIDSVQDVRNTLEKQLTRQASKQFVGTEKCTFEILRTQLTEKEAAIDFFNFFVTDEYGPFVDSIFYFALITRPQWEHPKLIQLLEDSALEDLLSLSSHYTLNAEVNHLLYQKIWAPLLPYLEGVTDIHLSADGRLHQVAFAGLFSNPDTDQTLLEQYQFYYYSNLRDMVKEQSAEQFSPKLLVVANADYDAGLKEIDNTSSDYFSALPGTELELNFLQKYSKSQAYPLEVYKQKEASEQKFRSTLTTFRPTIVHLATHGYFMEKDTTIKEAHTLGERIKTADNRLIRSGLVLSGVNKNWLDSTSIAPAADGVLTALEVANLSLNNTQLVVLSACNTGRGNFTDGEGVFGLQRAFKLAGAKYILVSLWKIPDQQTAELMAYFYTFLAQSTTPQRALYLAQQKMRERYENPFDWAGFILFE